MSGAGGLRPGGRTARTRGAVFDATVAELAACGYDRLSIEAVAQRAGVHKTTIYRRWGTREQLVAEALQVMAERRIPIPDTGHVQADLGALARAVAAVLRSDEGAGAVRALAAGAPGSPEIARVGRQFWATRLQEVMPLIERGVARGQLPPGTDGALVITAVAAPLYHRLLVTGEVPDDSSADRAASAALAAARAGVFTPPGSAGFVA